MNTITPGYTENLTDPMAYAQLAGVNPLYGLYSGLQGLPRCGAGASSNPRVADFSPGPAATGAAGSALHRAEFVDAVRIWTEVVQECRRLTRWPVLRHPLAPSTVDGCTSLRWMSSPHSASSAPP